MQGKKEFLANTLKGLGLFPLLKHLNKRCLLILNFHRLYQGKLDTVFDAGVFSHSVDMFEEQLKWLTHNVNLVSEADLLEHLKTGKPFSKRSVMITFDDGYSDNYTLAYPLLKQYQVPAIFFVPTKVISERNLVWSDVLTYLLNMTQKSSVKFNNTVLPLTDLAQKSLAINLFLKDFKSNPDSTVSEKLAALTAQCDVKLPDPELQSQQLMTWDQLREIAADALVSIGSHSHSHDILSHLTAERQRQELNHSKELLEQQLGHTVYSLSYPVGGPNAFDVTTKAMANEVGYKLGFSFCGRCNTKQLTDPYHISRFESATELAGMVASLYLPRVFL